MISLIQAIITATLLSLFSAPSTIYNVGDEVADFTLKNVDGKFVSLSNFPSAKGFVIVFTSNRCPVAKAYQKRLIELNSKFAREGYPLILINPNDPVAYAAESFDNMRRIADKNDYNFSYLQDIGGKLAATFGAIRTPEAFVLNNERGKVILRYAGEIDDNAHDEIGVDQKYVEQAIERLKIQFPVRIHSTKPIGCGIKWKG
jgi:peroxiredoxin